MYQINKKNKKKYIYLAGPLFSEAERIFNERLTQQLEEYFDVYLPQRDGSLMSEMIQNGVLPKIAASRVFKYDINAIYQCNYLIAILDGRAIDEGVAFELGIAYANSKRCIGLQTDSRRLAAWGNNPMISGALEEIFTSPQKLIDYMKRDVNNFEKDFTETANRSNNIFK